MIDLTNATREDRRDWEQAISYLSRDPEARKMLAQLDRDNIKIEFIRDGEDRFLPDSHTIRWDPHSALAVRDAQGRITGVQSAALGLAHEAAHATDPDYKKHIDVKIPDYDDGEEAYAVGVEDRIAKTLGEPLRFNHRGRALPAADTTEHTVTNPDGRSAWVGGNGIERGSYVPGSLPGVAPRSAGAGAWRSLESGSESPVGQIGREMDAARDFVRQLQQSQSDSAQSRPALDVELARRAFDRGRE